MKKLAGLTLIEVLLVATIVAVLAGGGLAAYLDFNNRQILDSTADELKNNLRQARGWAMTGRKMGDCQGNLTNYQLQFDSQNKQYQIWVNCSLSGRSSIKTLSYDRGVTVSPGQNNFVFNALTGETGIPLFTITLNLGTRSRTLTVNSNGEIN